MNTHVFWYSARATGLVAWMLLTASVVWGLAVSTRVMQQRPKAGWILDLHRYLGGTAVVYTVAHIASLWADSYVHFDARALFVPFTSVWRPAAVAWGIAAVYVLVAIEVTSLLKRHISKRVWRAIHLLSFPLLAAAWIHAFTAGTDTGGRPARWFALASASIVLFLIAYRTLMKRAKRVALPAA